MSPQQVTNHQSDRLTEQLEDISVLWTLEFSSKFLLMDFDFVPSLVIERHHRQKRPDRNVRQHSTLCRDTFIEAPKCRTIQQTTIMVRKLSQLVTKCVQLPADGPFSNSTANRQEGNGYNSEDTDCN